MISQAITIKQISHLSGFSVSTVSKALNNKLDISKKTRDKIQNIAKQHNYIPNSYAVSLRVKKTASIAVILPDVIQNCSTQALGTLQKFANIVNYKVLFFQSSGNKSQELGDAKRLNDGSISGIIVISNETRPNTHFLDNNIPTEILNIDKNQSFETIKELSKISFSNLLFNT